MILVGVFIMIWAINSVYSVSKGNYDTSLIQTSQLMLYLVGILILVGDGLYIYSHYLLAKAKGYSGWLTLLGFINLIGLLILFLLPDKETTAKLS